MRQRGHPRKTLQEIERYAFAFEQRAGRTAHLSDALAFLQMLTLFTQQSEFFHSTPRVVNDRQQIAAREHERVARKKITRRAPVGRNAGLRGYVPRPAVFR